MNIGIYALQNMVTGEIYIGQSAHIKDRVHYHFSLLKRGYHENRLLQSSYDVFGRDNFVSYPILYCEKIDLDYYEQGLIHKFLPDFNTAGIPPKTLQVEDTKENMNLQPTIQAMLDARRDKIVAARLAGWNVKLIAREWGITPARVYQIIDKHNKAVALLSQEQPQ